MKGLLVEYYLIHDELLELNNKLDLTNLKLLTVKSEDDINNILSEITELSLIIKDKVNELENLRNKEKLNL